MDFTTGNVNMLVFNFSIKVFRGIAFDILKLYVCVYTRIVYCNVGFCLMAGCTGCGMSSDVAGV